jgi:hypothetical protein
MTEDTHSHSRAGWQSPLATLVTADSGLVLSLLGDRYADADAGQHAAWSASVEILQREGRVVIDQHPAAEAHGSILEYELPREGGRRPDIILLQDSAILVIEFKNKTRVHLGDIDQVSAYARDLREYHSECHGLPVIPILLYLGKALEIETEGVILTTPDQFAALVLRLAKQHAVKPPRVALSSWLQGRYEPLPGIVQAARLLFERQPLPFIRRAQSAGIPETVDYIIALCEEARLKRSRKLIMLTGVPGAGKTLVGLQAVHNERLNEWLPHDRQHLNPASFLSGNGPLVAVLQDALKNRTFVQDMHRYIREYAINDHAELPHERVVVFDEAQRAWTAGKVADFYEKKGIKVDRSEPELLVRLTQRMPEGCVILALIGTGQEIHTGEESGIEGWIDAIVAAGKPHEWTIHAPTSLHRRHDFKQITGADADCLDLNMTLRSHAAEKLHEWVNGMLDEPAIPEGALQDIAFDLRAASYPILVTRDLAWAKEYARTRFEGEANRRYGLLASSKARNLPKHGVDNGYDRFFDTAKWFNAEPSHAKSCCQLEKPAQEFHCQGLELDLPIVCWGDDVWWNNGWSIKRGRANPLVQNPDRFRRNTYRVLLTRGREGLLIFIPPNDDKMDAVADRLMRCGASTINTRRSKVKAFLAS